MDYKRAGGTAYLIIKVDMDERNLLFCPFYRARISEILTLKWENVDLSKRIAVVTHDKAKSGKSRALPLNHDAMQLLNAHKENPHEYVFVRTSTHHRISDIDRRDFRNACEKIGEPDLHFHDLRHTWASWHVQAGTPLFTLKEMVRWETLEMVRKYAHLNADCILNYANHATFTAHAGNVRLKE